MDLMENLFREQHCVDSVNILSMIVRYSCTDMRADITFAELPLSL